MNKIMLTLAQKHGYVNIIWGIGFLTLVIFELFGSSNISKLIGAISNLLCTLLVMISFLLRSETDDERSTRNLERAGQHSLLLTIILMALLNSILIIFKNVVIPPIVLVHGLIGFATLFYGFFFLYYEKEGC